MTSPDGSSIGGSRPAMSGNRPIDNDSALYFRAVLADENPKRDLAPRGGDAH